MVDAADVDANVSPFFTTTLVVRLVLKKKSRLDVKTRVKNRVTHNIHMENS